MSYFYVDLIESIIDIGKPLGEFIFRLDEKIVNILICLFL